MTQIVFSMHDRFYAEIRHFVVQANEAQSIVRFHHKRLPQASTDVVSAPTIDAKAACRHAFELKQQYGLQASDSFVLIVDGNIQDDNDDEYFIVNGREHSPADVSYAGTSVISLYYLKQESAFMQAAGPWWTGLPEGSKRRILADSVLLLMLYVAAYELTLLPYHEEAYGCVMDYCQTPAELVTALKGGLGFCPQVCVPALKAHPRGEVVLAIAESLTKHPFRFTRLPTGDFDVFLCHDPTDTQRVRTIGDQLKQRGLFPWLGSERQRPGFGWQESLQKDLPRIRSAAVFVGPAGLAPWQNAEMYALLRALVERHAAVIPVILPETTGMPALPLTLQAFIPVDFRQADPDPYDQLVWGITGEQTRTGVTPI